MTALLRRLVPNAARQDLIECGLLVGIIRVAAMAVI